jgi:hypothetical protein
MEPEWKQWQGGKLLHCIIAAILLCCDAESDGWTDLFCNENSLEMFRVWHVNHFPLTPSIS